MSGSPETVEDDRAVVWFDIDNTLYSASSKIADVMGQRIHAYFVSLGLSNQEASVLHLKYYKTYGLALRGLVRHHNVDPLDFDRHCDAALPLDEMLRPDPAVRKLLQDIDRSKVRVWALTNAYVTHALRVLRILQLDDQFEGVVFCDYAEEDFFCKPEPTYFYAAMKKAGLSDPSKCFFVDDSKLNVDAAYRIGWGHCVHFCEAGIETTEGGIMKTISSDISNSDTDGPVQIQSLEDLRRVWPNLFLNATE